MHTSKLNVMPMFLLLMSNLEPSCRVNEALDFFRVLRVTVMYPLSLERCLLMSPMLLVEVQPRCRVDEALDLFKELARKHGTMQEATLNSVVRALSEEYADRALRMLSLMRTLGMRPNHDTLTALIGSAARASRIYEAKMLYRCDPIISQYIRLKVMCIEENTFNHL